MNAHAPTPDADAATEVATIPRETALTVLTDAEKFNEFYERVKAEADAHVPDVTTDKGRKAIASLAFKVVKTKTAIDAAGKALTEEARAQIKKVDESRKAIRDKLDALRDEVRKPLTEWEEAEAQRVADCKRQMEQLTAAGVVTLEDTSETVAARLDEVRGRNLDETLFGEEIDLAVQRRDNAVAALTQALERLRKEEADRAELERLREAEAERQRREEQRQREEAAARAEAESQARAEADARAAAERAERERLEADERAERQRREAAAAAERAAQEAAEQARAEAERRAQEEQAERERAHQEQLAEERRAREALETRAKEEADRRAREEREAEERARVEKRERERREADIAHRSTIMRAAKEALIEHCTLEEDIAKDVVRAISARLIPNVSIQF